MTEQTDFNQAEILPYLRQVFGAQCAIMRVEQFKNGARKQVFFIDLSQPAQRCVLYIWHDLNHYFSEREGIETTQSDASAPALFKVNAAHLLANGITIPQIYYMGRLAAGYDFALLEYIAGENFTAFAANASPEDRNTVLEQIGRMLRKLNQTQRAYPGTLLDSWGPQSEARSELSLQRALLEVNAAADTHESVAVHKARIEQKLHELSANLAPRTSYRLIHGELGPEHILIRQRDQAVYFVDIDGLHFSDIEVEHALMKVRFSAPTYDQYFRRTDLDAARMAFYEFALYVSFVYAGTRFILKNYPDQVWAQGLFSANLARVIKVLDA